MSGTEGKTVIIAPGNPFRGDDGIGPEVAKRLKARGGAFTILDGAMDALRILSAWEGAPLALVVDAAMPGDRPGTVWRGCIDGGAMPRDLARCSSHGLGIAEAVALSRVLGLMPGRLVVYAVEAKTFALGAAISPEIEAVLEDVVRRVEGELAAFARAGGPCDA
jgi:hydrogenase maturation protease